MTLFSLDNIVSLYLWRAEPCLTIRSLQVLRSSTLLLSVRNVDWTSELRQLPPCPEVGGTAGHSSPESSEEQKQKDLNTFHKDKDTHTVWCWHWCCCVRCFNIHSQALCDIFVIPLTRFSLHADSLCLGELQSSDPSLALYFRAGLQMVGLRPSIGNDKIAGILHSNIGCGQVDGASACVTHLCLGPGDKQNEKRSNAEFLIHHRAIKQQYICLTLIF